MNVQGGNCESMKAAHSARMLGVPGSCGNAVFGGRSSRWEGLDILKRGDSGPIRRNLWDSNRTHLPVFPKLVSSNSLSNSSKKTRVTSLFPVIHYPHESVSGSCWFYLFNYSGIIILQRHRNHRQHSEGGRVQESCSTYTELHHFFVLFLRRIQKYGACLPRVPPALLPPLPPRAWASFVSAVPALLIAILTPEVSSQCGTWL